MDPLLHLLDNHVPKDVGKIICGYVEFKIVKKLLGMDNKDHVPSMGWSCEHNEWAQISKEKKEQGFIDPRSNKEHMTTLDGMNCKDDLYVLSVIKGVYNIIRKPKDDNSPISFLGPFKYDGACVTLVRVPPNSNPSHIYLLVQHFDLTEMCPIKSLIRFDVSGRDGNFKHIPLDLLPGSEWTLVKKVYKDHNGKLYGWIYNKDRKYDWSTLVSAYYI